MSEDLLLRSIMCEPKGRDCISDSAGTGTFGSDAAMTEGFLDTVHLCPIPGEAEDEKIVRPCLAILFRVAVGPAADYYAPRFLEYERIGRSFPSWNWVSVWVPAVWAFHHKLWGAGLAFSLWSVATMASFDFIDPYLDDSIVASLACALALLWLVPGIVAALTANSLLFYRTRRIVRKAESATPGPLEAARWIGRRPSVAPEAAVLLGGAAMIIALFAAAPNLRTAATDRVVRTHVAEALTALEPLQRRVENRFGIATPSLTVPNHKIFEWERGADFLEAVSVSPASGRVRAVLGALIPELAGQWIVLAPVLDRDERVHWICVPVGIPVRYLPRACRGD